MPRYILVCETPNTAYIQHHSNGTLRCADPTNINAQAGELQAVEFVPTIGQLTDSEREQLNDHVVWVFAVSLMAGFAGRAMIKFIKASYDEYFQNSK